MNQYEVEYDYIMNKYFNNFQVLSDLKKVKGRPVSKCDVLIDNNPYELYKYEIGEVILIPKVNNLFESDFKNIYRLLFRKNIGIHFFIMRKQNGNIENFYYDFLTNSNILLYPDSIAEVSLKYNSIEDQENNLYKIYKEDNISLELFLVRYRVNELKSIKKEKIVIVRRNKDNIIEKHTSDSIKADFADYINHKTKFERLDITENTSFINITQSIIDNKKINDLNINSNNENAKILRKIFNEINFNF